MWDDLKQAPLIWKLIAFFGIPIAAIFACGTVGIFGYLIINRSFDQPQPDDIEVVSVVSSPTMPSSSATVVNPLTATLVSPEATPTVLGATPTPSEIGYELNWKIEQDQPIAYNTAMEVSECCTSVDYDRIFNFEQADQGNEMSSHFEEMFEDLSNNQPTYSLVSILEKKPEGNISVKMVLDNVEMPEQETEAPMGEWYGQMLKGMEGNVQLQGEITPEGEIASPFVAQQQKNFLALFFELPVGPVKIGDTWQIDLTCITVNSAQFEIDNYDRVNQVTLKEIIETPEGEAVAILDYLIAESVEGEQSIPFFAEEPVPTSMECGFLGRGEFLIEQGQWRAFSAEYTIQSTGMITSDVTQQLALTPLDKVPTYSEPNRQEQPSLSEIITRPQETKVCLYESQDVLDTNTDGYVKFASYVADDDNGWAASKSIILQLSNIELPEELYLDGEKFVRNPFDKMIDDEQRTIPLDSAYPAESPVSLTLTIYKEDVQDAVTLSFEGQDYFLTLVDGEMNEYCRK